MVGDAFSLLHSIEHLVPKENHADGLSKQLYYVISYQQPVAQILTTFSVEAYDYLTPATIAARASDSLPDRISSRLVT